MGARSVSSQRAAILRERRCPCYVMARWLDCEGYTTPKTDAGHRTRSEALKVLRQAQSA
jgi:hypothetical protein